ncbi:MAG: ABC transporter ATP-binding protein [Aestuariivirgaceae bacterium]
MASVTIGDVRKSFGSTEVLHGVSIDIPNESFTVLVGPSGCGKSTLLRMIAGLEEVTSGEISIGGRVVNQMPPKERDIAMVFQNYALYPHMTVFDNMGFSLKLAKASPGTIAEKVRTAAAILNLDELLDRYPRQLSGGQRQRVAMGRAIVRDPQVFLFDEPLSNLDAKLRVQMRTEIKELHQRLNSTSVYVTHDQIEAMTMADQIVVMRDGVIEQAGAPLELYDNPDNQFVATFIGSPAMNMLSGTIGVKGGKANVTTSDGKVLPLANGLGADEGTSVLYGLRPEYFSLATNGAKGAIKADVAVVEPTGAETLVICRIEGQDIQVLFTERHDLKPGQTISLMPDGSKALLFENGSGQRIR